MYEIYDVLHSSISISGINIALNFYRFLLDMNAHGELHGQEMCSICVWKES
jgi:hypothetical protein